MSRHRRVSGRHRKPAEKSRATTALLASVAAGAFCAFTVYDRTDPEISVTPVQAAITSAALDAIMAPAQPSVKTVAAVNVQAAQRIPAPTAKAEPMLVASVPLVGGNGLTPNAKSLAWYIQTHYPAVKSIGGVRFDPLPDHPSGHAIDIMVYGNRSLGDKIMNDVLAQSNRFGVKYVIWQETYHNPAGAVRWMADRGSPTANHFDHVHVTVW